MMLAVANRKGGVGKTTISVALSTQLAKRHKVLPIDLDSQVNATEALGIDLAPGVFTWLGAEQLPELEEISGLHVIPGNARTERANLILTSEGNIAGVANAVELLDKSYVLA